MYCNNINPLKHRDVIGVELFLIRQGISKSKPKFRIIEAYGKHININIDSNYDKYDRALLIAYYTQYNFQAFRQWFKTYNID